LHADGRRRVRRFHVHDHILDPSNMTIWGPVCGALGGRRFGPGRLQFKRDEPRRFPSPSRFDGRTSLFTFSTVMAAAVASARGQRAAILASPLAELTGICLAVDCLTPGCAGERTFAITDLAHFYGDRTKVSEVLRRMRCTGGCGGPVRAAWLVTMTAFRRCATSSAWPRTHGCTDDRDADLHHTSRGEHHSDLFLQAGRAPAGIIRPA